MKRTSALSGYRYSIEGRAMVLCAGFVIMLTALSMRLIHVQHTLHEVVMDKMKEKIDDVEVIPARRGDILDRDRRPLATTEPVSDLMLNKHQLPDVGVVRAIAKVEMGLSDEELEEITPSKSVGIYYQLLATRLARPLKRTVEDLMNRLNDSPKYLVIQKEVDSQLAREIVKELERDRYRGLKYRDSTRRAYVSNELACHVLGFVNHQMEGAEGVEASMDGFLKGADGSRSFDREGDLVGEVAPQHGRHVVLTIDSAFQGMAEKIVDQHFQETRAQAITAIFAEPKSGEILALVNRPGFNPAHAGNSEPRTRWNRAVSAAYEPGSTFKIVTLGAAMNMGLVGLDTWVNCFNGYHREEGWEKALEDSAEGRPAASVRDVLAFSLNTGTYSVARQMKPQAYYDTILKFGFGEVTGIRLPAETSGTVPHPVRGDRSNMNDGWGRSSMALSRLGMGYNLSVSPLQCLGMMSVICNDGDRVKPRVVSEILTEDYERVSARLESDVVENVISPRTCGLLRNALIHAVKEGTGKLAQVDGYVVGGKTGTTMKIVGKSYRKNRNLCSFLGFIGSETEPALIGMVLVDDPQTEGNRHGGTVAAPIFKEIAEAGMYHFGVRRLASANVEIVD